MPARTDKTDAHDWKIPTDDLVNRTEIGKPISVVEGSLREFMISDAQKAELDAQAEALALTDAQLETLTAPADNAAPQRRATDVMERFNAGKLKLGLIPPSLNYYLGMVLMYGALKYAEHNWRKGGSWVENSESLQRHLDLWKEGEDCDAESGLPHLAHIAFNTMALIEFYDKGLGSDDRFRYPSQPADQRRPGRTLSFREPPRRV